MKILWLTSFRPFGLSVDNDNTQNLFLNSIKYFGGNIKLIVTQFGEKNVKENLDLSNVNYILKNYDRKKLPPGEKFSNQIMCHNALEEFCQNNEDYDFLVYSTCDIVIPTNLICVLNEIKSNNFMAYVFPNTLVKNSKILKTVFPLYGIDLIIFKIDKIRAQKFFELNKGWEQYGWGVNEHYYMSMKDALKLSSINLWKKMDIIKFENDFAGMNESRIRQIEDWNKNKNFFLKYLKKNRLSKFWALGSYYFIILKHFNFKYLTPLLFLKYCLMFIKAPLILIFKLFGHKDYTK